MQHIFFNLDGDFQSVSSSVFSALGVGIPCEGDSSNVLNGVYYSHSIFGLNLKLERNSYDYEDRYAYMLSVTEDPQARIESNDQIAELCSSIVVKLLAMNLGIVLARETLTGLELSERE